MRMPRVLPTVLDQRLRVAMMAVLASVEAAGELVYVRIRIMCLGGAHGKIRPGDVDPAFGTGPAAGRDAARPDEAGEMFLGVARAPRCLREVQQLVRSAVVRCLDPLGRPLQGAGPRFVGEGVPQLNGLGTDLCQRRTNRVRLAAERRL